MSEMSSRESYTRYDEMSTDQLREILRKHAHGELEKEPDTEELFYMMEVLQNRESTNPEKQIKSTEEAYATFVKHYAPQMAKKKPIPPSKHGAVPVRWAKWAAAVAVIVVALTAVSVGAQAFVPNFWEKVAIWTQEFFRFGDVTDGTEGKTPGTENNAELDSLHEALEQQEGVAPHWIPEGYICTSINAKESPKALRISAIYKIGEEQLVIQIRREFGSDPVQIEKNEDLIEIYTVDGVDYYIFSNDKYMQTAWVVGEYECIIIGKLTMEEMKKAIDSI